MSGKKRFGRLLEPGAIGPVRTRNRIVKVGSGTCLLEPNGFINERFKSHYEAIAKGGAGLIIIEDCTVEFPRGAHHMERQVRLDDDMFVPGFRDLTEAIHSHHCPTFIQLLHAGAWDPGDHRAGGGAVSSSHLTEKDLPGPLFVVAKALTISEIHELVDKFASAAERAKKAGFDGVEINAATCHLVNSFLSPFWNRREDEYGYHNLKSRARFAIEIVREIKKRVGKDFPVSVLMNGAEYGLNKGITIEDSKEIARLLEDAGVDVLHIRAFGYGEYFRILQPDQLYYPEPLEQLPRELDWTKKGAGSLVPLAASVKKVVSVPLITVGKLESPELGNKVLQQGKADFIGMARGLLSDPERPNKIASGRIEDITPCMGCLECVSSVIRGEPIRCRVNAALGREKEYTITPAIRRKKILIVGGGPAGMEAARVSAIRGHDVFLCDKEPKLGGLLRMAAFVKGLEIENLETLINYLKRQLLKHDVKIILGKEVNTSLIEQIKPDAIIVAIGSKPSIQEIPGMNRPNVVSGLHLHLKLKAYLRFFGPKMLRWLTKFWIPIGYTVVIMGGSIQGCQLAEFFIKRGRKVIITDTADRIGIGLGEAKQIRFFDWMVKKGVRMISQVKYDEITERGLTVILRNGQRQIIETDTIVLMGLFGPNTDILKDLKGKVSEIYFVGDCREPGLIIDAIADGYQIAMNL